MSRMPRRGVPLALTCWWEYRLDRWLLPALVAMTRRRPPRCRPVHLLFLIADHFEPYHDGATRAQANARLRAWLTLYPRLADRHRDADGRPPRHTFFYPIDQLDPGHLSDLVALCRAGYGEVEVHLHHRDDTEESLTTRLRRGIERYHAFGALGSWPGGQPAYGFVHGDWALDNSIHESGQNRCGVNSELLVLARTGCYADFTFPALGASSQPRTLNRIYYARDDPKRPRSYDRGIPAAVGRPPAGDLLLVEGPLGIAWRTDRGLARPYCEDGDVTATKGWRPERVDFWVRADIHVVGRPEWVFVKVHTHGAADANCLPLLRRELDLLFTDLETRFNDGEHFRLHYVTAREAYNLVRAAEAGLTGDPVPYRDFVVAPPAS